jgi:hypothetical protein
MLTTPWQGELLRKFELTGDLLPGGAQRDSMAARVTSHGI